MVGVGVVEWSWWSTAVVVGTSVLVVVVGGGVPQAHWLVSRTWGFEAAVANSIES